MITWDLSGKEFGFSLDILFDMNQQLLKLVFGFECDRLELFSFLWLDFVIVHGLIDMAEIITKLFFVMKLLVDYFKAFV